MKKKKKLKVKKTNRTIRIMSNPNQFIPPVRPSNHTRICFHLFFLLSSQFTPSFLNRNIEIGGWICEWKGNEYCESLRPLNSPSLSASSFSACELTISRLSVCLVSWVSWVLLSFYYLLLSCFFFYILLLLSLSLFCFLLCNKRKVSLSRLACRPIQESPASPRLAALSTVLGNLLHFKFTLKRDQHLPRNCVFFI